MQDFFTNISRYPRFLLGLVLGVFLAFLSIFQPFLKNPITAVALVGLAIGSFVFLYFTLEAMLGLN
jgi:uncharacterized membrane protein